ncbi:MAG: helix-turn-helix transcriptional regulator [Clostridiales bacterium]|nr:helix-turn-helix transcriptional regulator [Clostridiales bacterium]
MEINAYSRDYVENAQKNLGHMLDYAVNSLSLNLNKFYEMFLVSMVSEQFEIGNPAYVVGKNGCELAKEVLRDVGKTVAHKEEEMYLDKSPEYWTGWALAFYQWYRGVRFSRIQEAVPVEVVLGMYMTMHEADIMKFVTVLNEKMKSHYKETNLKRLRKNAGYSQRQLAEEAGISVRQIQLFEQQKRDINKTQLETAVRLSKALGCRIEDLVEL